MSRTQKVVNLLAVVVPFAGFIAAVPLLWGSYVAPRDLIVLGAGYLLTCLGISIGYHRLFTHRSYETVAPVRYALAVLGTMAVQGSLVTWVADHRKHHNFSDREGDPHSPHVGHGEGWQAALKGLWHAHVGWLWGEDGHADQARYAKDVLADRGLVWISRLFFPLAALSLAIPFAIGWAWGGTLGAGLQMLFWAGLIRVFALHHVTWSVNSVCHFVGRRRFRVKDESRNVWWLAPFSLGEAWHHNHHAFPSSAFHGLRRWEVDVSGLVIAAMEKVGLARKVVRIPPELQAKRAATRAAAAAGAEAGS